MEPKSNTPIILCGGDINYSHLPIGTNRSNAMIPVNGKPVIGWILDELAQKGFREAVVVLQFDNQKLGNYLQWSYSGRFQLHFAYVQPQGSILHSLLAGLSWVMPGKGIYLILGDTLIEDGLPQATDFVFTGPYDEPENWCLAESNRDGFLKALYDKITVNKAALSALAGGYGFSRADVLRTIVVQQIQQEKKELSAAIEAYNALIPLKTIPAHGWYDFGHIGGFNRAKRTLLQSRYFNTLSIDPVKGVITKRSEKTEKLTDELNWYNSLPDSLKIFTPRILASDESNGGIEIVQEFYGYPNLAELYVFGDLNLSVWKNALQQLMAVHLRFRAIPGVLHKSDLEAMYRDKTFSRLELLKTQPFWEALLTSESIEINGRVLRNLPLLSGALNEGMDALLQSTSGSIIHGDYCFSNILYDLNTQIIRLIDPRGSFGTKGIFGDPRYDMAKLRHSVSGLYDFILADLFQLENLENSNEFRFEIFKPEKQEILAAYADGLIADHGYVIHEIKLIEALLFLSMVPYHAGKEKRQIAMYLTGIRMLNKIFDHENSDRSGRHDMSDQTKRPALP